MSFAKWIPVALFSTLLTANAQNIQITEQAAPIVYETKADLPTPASLIAEIISSDYRRLGDEFAKQEQLQALKPVITKKIEDAKKATSFSVIVDTLLEEYNFEMGGFPSSVSSSSYIPFNRYAVRFSNPEELSYILVPLEQAKSWAPSLQRSRICTRTYTGTVDRCMEETLNRSPYKVIYLKVSEIKLEPKGVPPMTYKVQTSK